ncbi:hypothetical protein Ciccas_009229 [Cichlidogyrus casuarinus]|uniref:Uncharacterized protein n=1 Tax=Cichlidogyrus casuarinus TaxID=1844966 RepID=A0ABD2PXM9_9PLAT
MFIPRILLSPVTPSDIPFNDSLLRFFGNCKKYQEEIDDNDPSKVYRKAFQKLPEVVEELQDIQRKLQLDGAGLEFEDFNQLFYHCGYHKAKDAFLINPPNYPSCDFISERLGLMLEYHNTIKQYWKKSYSYTLNYEIACPLLSTMLNEILEAKNAHAESKE